VGAQATESCARRAEGSTEREKSRGSADWGLRFALRYAPAFRVAREPRGEFAARSDAGSKLEHPGLISMRAVIQRVSSASVTIAGQARGAINAGLLVLAAVEESDTAEDVEWLSGKLARLRIFNDENGVMNRSVMDVVGDILLISQFTLFASTKKGNRPSYSRAARPEVAIPLYESLIARLSQDLGKPIQTGEFGADMQVALLNDGPVTILIDTRNRE